MALQLDFATSSGGSLSISDPLDQLQAFISNLAQEPPDDLEIWAGQILKYGADILASGSPELQFTLLEQGWEPVFTELIKASHLSDAWFDLEMNLIRALNYTPGLLFRRRCEQLGKKSLFRFRSGREWQKLSWSAVRTTVEHLAAGLIDLVGSTKTRVAIFSENRLEVAYTDIMCLSYGFVNVPIQPAAPPAQIEYILQHAEIEVIFVADSQQLKTIENLHGSLPGLKHIVTYNDTVSPNPNVHSFRNLLTPPNLEETMHWLEGVRLSVNLDDIASIMYTSGTTGYPKGIVFTYANIISKRFARSLAFNLGGEDRFLCFLPLFHTFGRFLELWGSIFWGAEYTFSSGKGSHSLLEDLRTIQPSVLISIPKRWQDIYEAIAARVDLIQADWESIHEVMQAVTGGNLRWGLSAAGYLPPEIFKFFQSHGLQLHSGYGMTEATGGITMTPTGGYLENSVGSPLPGMEIKLAEDGELWIRGAYVSTQYWKPELPEERPQGWFTTGDIFQPLGNGQLEIIDRKKEIYKNDKGQTVAPQKIENMFRDFDSIQQLFIVGDHRPYNTALIRVNRKNDEIRVIQKEPHQALRDYIGTMIHSVNSFLAPFERIVNFRLIDREFTKEMGELTEKGTYKRSTILEHFKDEIEDLYETHYKPYLIQGLEVQIPNWVFLQRGWTRNDLEVSGATLRHRNRRYTLTIQRQGEALRIGSFYYQFSEKVLQFDDFIRQPAYCIGNRELEIFLDYANLHIKEINKAPLWLPGKWEPSTYDAEERTQFETAIQQAQEQGDNSLEALKPIIRLIYSESLHPSQGAFRLLARIYSVGDESLRNIIRYAFLRLIRSDDLDQSRFAVQQVVALYPANELEKLVYYAFDTKLLFPLDAAPADWSNINVHKVNLASDFLKWLAQQHQLSQEPTIMIQNIVGILLSWSRHQPRFFAKIRTTLISAVMALPLHSQLRSLILEAYAGILADFATAMAGSQLQGGSTTQDELTAVWESLLLFDESVREDHRRRIFGSFVNTSFFNESMYLFFDGTHLPLKSIPPQGIWINLLGAAHGKTVYRATIQGKDRSYKFAIDLNDDLTEDQLRTELFWLLACGRDQRQKQLVETIGSYQQTYDLWSEEFISGLTARQYLQKAVWAGASEDLPAPEHIWPHFVWTGVYTYTSFWKRTRVKKRLKVPSPGKIIIPVHDYYTGGRLVSISDIQDSPGSLEFLENLEAAMVRHTEAAFPEFNLKAETDIIYAAIREALGQKHSPAFFEEILADPALNAQRQQDLERYLEQAHSIGFVCKAVYFANRRYHRWITLNQGATLDAKAHFLKGLYQDYNIAAMETEYPDARVQLFARTVFSEADDPTRQYLTTLAANLRQRSLDGRSLQSEISQYLSRTELDEFQAFFLKRLAFPALPPSDDIELIATRSTSLDDIEVMISRHDQKGGSYRIRKAMHPREIMQLQQLFIKASMSVNFSQEHHYLVALNQKERVIGGIFFLDQSNDLVYMDKVVVSEAYRRTGVSRGILEEFFNRMRSAGKKMIITGFLHPGYFYKFGFQIEKDQGGLVKYL